MKRRNFLKSSVLLAAGSSINPLQGIGADNAERSASLDADCDALTNPVVPASDATKIFRAGASIKSIMPPEDQMVGNRTVVQNDHDSLYVRSLLLDDGDIRLLFVAVDVVGIDDYLGSVVKRRINERTGIPAKNIMLSATHTHFGFSLRRTGRNAPVDKSVWADYPLDPYQNLVAEQSAASAAAALANLEPAHIGWGKANVPQWAHNRRFRMKNALQTTPWGEKEYVYTNPPVRHPDIIEPLGPADPEVSFISAQAPDGRPIALFASYSSHYPADIPAPYISADYYGVFAKEIQSFLKADGQAKPFVGSITMGTGGDQAAVDRRVGRPPGTILQTREQMGFDIAKEVYQANDRVRHKPWVKLNVAQSSLKLHVRKVTDPDAVEYAKMLLSRQRQGLPFMNHRLETNYAVHVLNMRKVWPDQIDMTLQAFRIGDLAVVAVPGEVFVETGLAIKKKSPFAGVYTNGMSNGSFGYLPTARQHELMGYETWIALSNRVEMPAATKIEAEALNMLSKLYDKI